MPRGNNRRTSGTNKPESCDGAHNSTLRFRVRVSVIHRMGGSTLFRFRSENPPSDFDGQVPEATMRWRARTPGWTFEKKCAGTVLRNAWSSPGTRDPSYGFFPVTRRRTDH